MTMQDVLGSSSFSQCLLGELVRGEIRIEVERGIRLFREEVQRHQKKVRYSEWLARAEQWTSESNLECKRQSDPLEGVHLINDTVYDVVRFTEGGIRNETERQGARRSALDKENLKRALG
jgi:hypothetical protein